MEAPNTNLETAHPPKDKVVIRLRNVSKRYILHRQKPFLAHDALKRLMGKRSGEEFWALKDVSLDIHEGESVAVVGGNGAGKSTMLGLVAGTVYPTTGSIDVRGRVGALLELGAGFHHDLTGRENIYLNASLLGLQKEEIEEQYKKILNFSELHEFIDVPLRNYSSGMNVRLGFSVAVHIKPEILLMDEVLAVGDPALSAEVHQADHQVQGVGGRPFCSFRTGWKASRLSVNASSGSTTATSAWMGPREK